MKLYNGKMHTDTSLFLFLFSVRFPSGVRVLYIDVTQCAIIEKLPSIVLSTVDPTLYEGNVY